MALCALSVLVLILPSGAAAAIPSSSWQEVAPSVSLTPIDGPTGLAGRVSAIVALPGRVPTQVAGTLAGLWLKSGSRRWRNVTNRAWPSTSIGALAVDPRHASVLYAGTGYDLIDDSSAQRGDGILKSTDGGRRWTPLAGSETMMLGQSVTGLAVDPHDDQVIVAATNNGLYRSADGGQSWTRTLAIPGGVYRFAEVRLASDPVTGILLAGVAQAGALTVHAGAGMVTTGHAIFRSTNAGQTWTGYAVDAVPGPGLVVAPALDTAHRRTFTYALDVTGAGGSGLYTSASQGQTWTLASRRIQTKDSIGQLVVDPRSPRHAYFAQSGGPFSYIWGQHQITPLRSNNGSMPSFGDWRSLSLGPAAHRTYALYGGDDGGTSSYDFTTRRYSNANAGLVSGLDYGGAATSARHELSGAQDLGIDLDLGGSSVQAVYAADAFSALFDAQNARTVYAAVYPPGVNVQFFVVSHDGGTKWSRLRLPTPDTDATLMTPVQAAGDPRVLILPEENGTMYVSSDDGGSWSVRSIPGLAPDYLRTVAAALIPGTSTPVIYAGTGFGRLYRSADLGVTWTPVTIPNPANLSVRAVLLQAASSTGAGGEHVDVALGPYSPGVYAGPGPFGAVLDTGDSGAHWSQLGSMAATGVNTLALSGSTLVAGTDTGVVQWTGTSWAPVGSGFPNVPVTDVFESRDATTLFATTYGRGTLTLPLVAITLGSHGPLPPANSSPPAVTGLAVVGHTVGASVGTWAGSPRPRYGYQWQLCRSRCVDIAGATDRTYRLSRSERGARVRVVVRATNRLGSRTAASLAIAVASHPLQIGDV